MSRVSGPSRRGRLVVCLAAVTVLLLGGGIAWAAVPDPSGVITGCVDTRYGTGVLRVVDAAQSCLRHETRITWNQQGATGDRGPAGAPGVAGPAGPQGQPGAGVGSFDDLVGLPCRDGTPQEGVIAIGWSAEDTATITCVATILHELSVTLAGSPTGTVTSTPAGISCGSDCTKGYSSGTVVTLTATPATGSGFDGWSGACAGAGATCTVTMDEATSVTATFFQWSSISVVVHNTQVDGNPLTTFGANGVTAPGFSCIQNGAGSLTCPLTIRAGTAVTYTAQQSVGDQFLGWAGPCEGSLTDRTCTFTSQPGNQSLAAIFREG